MENKIEKFAEYKKNRSSIPNALMRESPNFENKRDFRMRWSHHPDERIFYQIDFFDRAVNRFVNCRKYDLEEQMNTEKSATMQVLVKNLENVNSQPRMFYNHRNEVGIQLPELPFSLSLSARNTDGF
jgi:hypothetical protein